MKVPALKDADGDYWIPFGHEGSDRICLTREGYVDNVGAISPDLLAISEYGPFTPVTLIVSEEEDPALSCDDCLYDRHFCYKCDDAVSHGHVHDDD